MSVYLLLLCSVLCNLLRRRRDLALENLALRQQLLVLSRSSRRVRFKPGDRRFWSRLTQQWTSWRSTLVLVQPDTRRPLAPPRLAAVLDMEEPPPRSRPSPLGARGAGADPAPREGEPALGQRPHPG